MNGKLRCKRLKKREPSVPKLPRNIRRVKVKKAHLAQWFGLMGDMLQVGFSIRQTLEFTMTMMPKQALVIAYVEKQLERGVSFADARSRRLDQSDDRKGDVDGGNTVISHAVSHKEAVHNGVDTGEGESQNGRDDKT